MKIEGINKGEAHVHFEGACNQVKHDPHFKDMHCFMMITVVPSGDGTNDNIRVQSVGSEHDQHGMLATFIEHMMRSQRARKEERTHEPADPLLTAENPEELKAIVDALVAKVQH